MPIKEDIFNPKRHYYGGIFWITIYTQNEKLRNFLISTDDKVLVEASPKDEVWGIGLDEHSPEATCPRKWKDTNLLGFALMEVRDKLRKQE